MSRILGSKSGYSTLIDCLSRPLLGDFITATSSASGTANASGKSAKLGGIQVNTDTTWADDHRIRNGDFSVATLGTGQPPDGFSMFATTPPGVWATDARLWDAPTGVQKTGKYALQLLATAVPTKIEGPLFPVTEGEKIRAGAEWKAASTGVTVTSTLNYFASDGTTPVGSETTVFTKPAVVADTYEIGEAALTVPAGARYARLYVAKSAASVVVTVDRVWAARSQEGSSVGYGSVLDDVAASFNASIPFDATIPTLTEGAGYFSFTYTPRRGGRSKLVVELDVFAGIRNFADHMVWSLNDGQNTLSADAFYCGTAGKVFHAQIVSERSSPPSGSITFQARFGRAAANGQIDINYVNLISIFGTAKKSSIRVTEVSNV